MRKVGYISVYKRLRRISAVPFGDTLSALKEVFAAGDRRKYLCLFESLESLGLVELPGKLRQCIESGNVNIDGMIGDIPIKAPNPQLSVLYIQPTD